MSVGKICRRNVVMATPEENVRDAARRMAEHNVGTLVIVDMQFRPVGILTDRDIVLRCVAVGKHADELCIRDVMTVPVRTVSDATSIEEALKIMKRAGFRRLPVTDRKAVVIGIVALDDIVDLIAEETAEIGALLRKEVPAAM
jgi:CBS domain-containing protein